MCVRECVVSSVSAWVYHSVTITSRLTSHLRVRRARARADYMFLCFARFLLNNDVISQHRDVDSLLRRNFPPEKPPHPRPPYPPLATTQLSGAT